MATYVRLMAFKQRPGWGHETLMREVSDSLHLRRFCLIGSGERAPDESTVVEADVCYLVRGVVRTTINCEDIDRVVSQSPVAGVHLPPAARST